MIFNRIGLTNRVFVEFGVGDGLENNTAALLFDGWSGLWIAGLIVPANTPIANIAWKTFPALICGNTVVMKAAEDSPRIALLFAQLTKEAGLYVQNFHELYFLKALI
jgi:acyl-CoA reductase-like NAD-dependent aldehyde dehydrogenase